MAATNTIFNIQQFLFESNDCEVLLKGISEQGVMKYESELIVSHTQLNMILNLLQRQNPDIVINDCIEDEPMYNGETLYSGNFTELQHVYIDLDAIAMNMPMKQIRA